MKNFIQKSITDQLLKSETQFNCPTPIKINFHVHQTKFSARRHFTYRRSRPKAVLQASKDGPELSDANVFNAQTDSMSPQKDPLPLNNNTLPPKDEMIPLCINTLPLPNVKYLLEQRHVSAMPTPAPSPSSRYSLLNRADQVPPCEPRSVRGWSGALLNDDKSLLTLKDVRGALSQM